MTVLSNTNRNEVYEAQFTKKLQIQSLKTPENKHFQLLNGTEYSSKDNRAHLTAWFRALIRSCSACQEISLFYGT
jgi:hypothetical protein